MRAYILTSAQLKQCVIDAINTNQTHNLQEEWICHLGDAKLDYKNGIISPSVYKQVSAHVDYILNAIAVFNH
jgi:hypothetical protein